MPGNQLFQNSAGDIFGSLQGLITALQTGTASDARTATNQLRTAFDSLTGQRIFYGNAVNQLNSTQILPATGTGDPEIAGQQPGRGRPH